MKEIIKISQLIGEELIFDTLIKPLFNYNFSKEHLASLTLEQIPKFCKYIATVNLLIFNFTKTKIQNSHNKIIVHILPIYLSIITMSRTEFVNLDVFVFYL